MLRGPEYRLLQTIIQGKVEGKRRLGRKNLAFPWKTWPFLVAEYSELDRVNRRGGPTSL
jgi:hypothetical protein